MSKKTKRETGVAVIEYEDLYGRKSSGVTIEIFDGKNTIRLPMKKDGYGSDYKNLHTGLNLSVELYIGLWAKDQKCGLYKGFSSCLHLQRMGPSGWPDVSVPMSMSTCKRFNGTGTESDFKELVQYVVWYKKTADGIAECRFHKEEFSDKSLARSMKKIPDIFLPVIGPEFLRTEKVSVRRVQRAIRNKVPYVIESLLLVGRHDIIEKLNEFPESVVLSKEMITGTVDRPGGVNSITRLLSNGASLIGSYDVGGMKFDFGSMSVNEKIDFFTVYGIHKE